MPIFLVKEPARVDGNFLLIVALIAPCTVLRLTFMLRVH
jgi:hypothetical protein